MTKPDTTPRNIRVLVILQHYLPGFRAGGPVRAMVNLIDWLGTEIDFYILTTNHDVDGLPYTEIETNTWQQSGNAQICYLEQQETSLLHFRKHILNCPHDILFIDGFFSSLSIKTLLLRRLGLLHRKPVLLSPRGHLEPGALSIKSVKKYLFMQIARLFRLHNKIWWHATSQLEYESIQTYRSTSRIRTIQDLPTRAASQADNFTREKQAGHLRMIFLSRISRKKNLDLAIQAVQHVSHKSGKIQFDIYGPIEDNTYWQDCQQLIDTIKRENIVIQYQGMLNFDEVIPTLQTYHLFFLPTRGENFGYVILEALSAGCPPLISDRTPWQDLNKYNAGWVIPLDEPTKFSAVIQHMVDIEQAEFYTLVEHTRDYVDTWLHIRSNLVEKMGAFFEDVAAQG